MGAGMEKRRIVGSVLMLSLVLLAGCGSKLPEMTTEQEDAIVEYAAGVVMQHVKEDGSRLVDLSLYEEKKEEPEATKEPEGGKMDETDNTDIVDNVGEAGTIGSLDELLVPEGITITYHGYKIVDNYPDAEDDNPFFALDASEGKKLLVLQFTIQNVTTEDKEIDIFSLAPKCTVFMNGTERKNTLSTMLLDDLSTYVGTMSGGEALEMVLLTEIDDTMPDVFESLSLRVKIESGSVTTILE